MFATVLIQFIDNFIFVKNKKKKKYTGTQISIELLTRLNEVLEHKIRFSLRKNAHKDFPT